MSIPEFAIRSNLAAIIGEHNALLMGKYLMAVFVRVFAQKVTANICPIELFVRGLIHFGLYSVIPKLLIP